MLVNLQSIQITDGDGDLLGEGIKDIQLTTLNGKLNVTAWGNVVVENNDTKSVTLKGDETEINETLKSLTYQSDTNYHGSERIDILVSDHAGLTDSESRNITIDSVNDPPILDVDVSYFEGPYVLRDGFRWNDNPMFTVTDPDGQEAGHQLVELRIDTSKNTTGNSHFLGTLVDDHVSGLHVNLLGSDGGLTQEFRTLIKNLSSNRVYYKARDEISFTPATNHEDKFEQNLSSISTDRGFGFIGEDGYVGFHDIVFTAVDAGGLETTVTKTIEQKHPKFSPRVSGLLDVVDIPEGSPESRLGDHYTIVITDRNGEGLGRTDGIVLSNIRDELTFTDPVSPFVDVVVDSRNVYYTLKPSGTLPDLIDAFHNTILQFKENFAGRFFDIAVRATDVDGSSQDVQQRLRFNITPISDGVTVDFSNTPSFVAQNAPSALRNIIVSDIDSNDFYFDDQVYKYTLTVNEGTLTIPDAHKSIYNTLLANGNYESIKTSGDAAYRLEGTLSGVGSGKLTLVGPNAVSGEIRGWGDRRDISDAFNNLFRHYLTYTPRTGFSGDDTLEIKAVNYDGSEHIFTHTITVGNINDPSAIKSTSTGYTGNEDEYIDIAGLSVEDPDGGNPQWEVSTVTLTSSNGELILPFEPNVQITGNFSSYVELKGTQAAINALLPRLVYKHPTDTSGSLTLQVDAIDAEGNIVGDVFPITVNSVNDPPTITNSGLPIEIDEDVATLFSAVSVNDVDGESNNTEGITEVTISAQNGTLDFGNYYRNLTNVGLDTNTLTLVYNQWSLNNRYLPRVVYTPTANYSGPEQLTFTVKDAKGETTTLSHDFTIKSLNDVPAVSFTLAKTDVDEEQSLQLDSISVTDGDLDVTEKLKSAEFSIPAGMGTLTFASTTNLIETGNGTNSVKLEGDESDIATALTDLVFEPADGFNGTLTLTVTAVDGVANPTTETIDLTVNAVNSLPEITLASSAFTIKEDEDFQLTGISVADHDREDEIALRLETVTFEVNLGNLTFDPVAGLTIENNGTNLVTLKRDTNPSTTALPDLINTALSKLNYKGYTNQYGNDTLNITALDAANITDTKSIPISLTSDNDDPVVTLNNVPTQTTEDKPLLLTGISVNDDDINDRDLNGNPTQDVLDRVELTVLDGTLTMGANTGNANITGDGTASVIVSGTQADINAVLAAITYQGTSNFSGDDTLTITAYDGVPATDTKTLTIQVAGENDDPIVIVQRFSETIDEDNSLAISDFSVDEQDGDRPTDGFKEMVLSANVGTITLTPSGIASITGNGSKRIVLSGPLQDVNDTLTSYIYQPDEHYHGSVTLTLRAEDQVGAFDVKTVTVTINSENDPPQIDDMTNLSNTVAEDGVMQVSQLVNSVQYHLTVQDPDTDPNHVLEYVSIVTLFGNLNVNSAPSGVTLTGNGTGTIRIENATPAQVNTLLESLTFSPQANYVGPSTIAVTMQDKANVTDTDSLSITVTQVNDPPVVTINLAQNSVDEDQDLTLSGISITDIDNGEVGFELTDVELSVTKGTLTFTNTTGVSNNGTATVTITGNQTDIATVLTSGLVYRGDLHANGDDTLTITANDGDTGQDIESTTLTVNAVNDPPVWTVSASPINVNEDASTSITGVSLLDPDGEEATHRLNQVTLAVNEGLVSIQIAPDLTISGNDSANVTLTGTAQAIMDAVQNMDYEPNLNFNGSDQLVMTAVDADNTVPQTLDISVVSVNDPPVIAGDFTDRSVNEDSSFNLVTVNTPLSVSDVDVGEAANEITSVLLTVNSGELSVVNPVSVASGNGSASLTLTGSEADINSDLVNLVYQGDDNFFGPDTFTIAVNDPNPSVTQAITINVASMNDQPEITALQTTYSVNEDAPLTLTGLSVVDLDEENPLHGFGTLVIAAQNGTLTATPSGAAQIADDTTASITLTGTHQDITQTLTTLTYQGTDHFHGTDTVTLTATDFANTEDSETLTITVNSVNDDPDVIFTNVPNSTNEDTPLPLTGLSVLDVDDGEEQLNVNGQAVVDQNGQAVEINSLDTVVLTVSNGELSISNQNSIAPAATLTLTGNSQSVSNLLSNLVYTPNPNFEGTDQLDIVATDQAGTTDTPSHTITVTSVNDKPVVSIGAMPTTVKEDEVLDLDAFRVADNDESDTANTNKLGTVTLNVSNGTLTLSSVAGLTRIGQWYS